MCRNIKKLRWPESRPTDQELHDAALQLIRKISGYRVPSQSNKEVFEQAVADVAAASRRMFDRLQMGTSRAPDQRQQPSQVGA